MANTDKPFGFRWIGSNPGGPSSNFALRPLKASATIAAALYRGDVVAFDGGAYVVKYTTGVAGSNVAGIAWGFEYLSTALGRRIFSTYLPTTDHAYDIDVMVIPIAGVLPQRFVVQAKATPFTVADIGQVMEPTDLTGGTSTGGHGRSAMTITQGGGGTTNTLPFRVVDLYSSIAAPGTPNTDDTANCNWVIVESNPFQATGI
jgi:hypothetical protein